MNFIPFYCTSTASLYPSTNPQTLEHLQLTKQKYFNKFPPQLGLWTWPLIKLVNYWTRFLINHRKPSSGKIITFPALSFNFHLVFCSTSKSGKGFWFVSNPKGIQSCLQLWQTEKNCNNWVLIKSFHTLKIGNFINLNENRIEI